MKKTIIPFSFLFLSIFSYSQSNHINQLDVSGYLFTNSVVQFQSIEGVGYFDDGKGFRFGFQYNRQIAKKIWINTGIGYLSTKNVYHGPFIGPTYPTLVEDQYVQLLQIPVRIRYDIFNWLYIKGGITLDNQFQSKRDNYIDNQSGVGLSIIGGIDLKITESIHVNIEPEYGILSMIPFFRENYQQHFVVTGINFNIGYRF